MLGSKKIACIIPARLNSKRFPQKILTTLLDKPLLEWVWNAACATKRFSTVTFAIDSQEAANLIERFGGTFVMTSPTCTSGTERLIEVMHQGTIDADIWINWQADEPFISKKVIGQLLHSIDADDAGIWTLKTKITHPEEISSPHCTKVVCDRQGSALYFSRAPIPFYLDFALVKSGINEHKERLYHKHVGIYAYTKETLQKIAILPSAHIEEAEKLEQLRFIYHGLKIRVHEIDEDVIGIDTPQDLKRAEDFAKSLGT